MKQLKVTIIKFTGINLFLSLKTVKCFLLLVKEFAFSILIKFFEETKDCKTGPKYLIKRVLQISFYEK